MRDLSSKVQEKNEKILQLESDLRCQLQAAEESTQKEIGRLISTASTQLASATELVEKAGRMFEGKACTENEPSTAAKNKTLRAVQHMLADEYEADDDMVPLSQKLSCVKVKASTRAEIEERAAIFQKFSKVSDEDNERQRKSNEGKRSRALQSLLRAVIRALFTEEEFLRTNFSGRRQGSKQTYAADQVKLSVVKTYCADSVNLTIDKDQIRRAYSRCRETAVDRRNPRSKKSKTNDQPNDAPTA